MNRDDLEFVSVRTRRVLPDPGILEAIGLNHSLPSAIADLVDNSIDAEKPPRVFRLDPGTLYLSDPDLDFCFTAVAPRAVDGTPLDRHGYLRLFPNTGKILRDEYATIIQHPNGRQKHLASRNNKFK